MRNVVVAAAVVLLAALGTTPGYADTAAWCAILAGRGGGGGTNCGFYTWGQCRTYISGIGGVCEPNPFYRPPIPQGPYKVRKHKRRHHYQ